MNETIERPFIGIMEGSWIERHDKIINAVSSVKSEEELNKVLLLMVHEIIESHLLRKRVIEKPRERLQE